MSSVMITHTPVKQNEQAESKPENNVQGHHSQPGSYGAPENSGTQRDRIYKLLMSRQGQWVSCFELAKTGILQYSARVYELRHHNGVTIENETVTVDSQKHGYFRIPIPGETSRPPLPEQGTVGKKASRSSRRTYHHQSPEMRTTEPGSTRGVNTNSRVSQTTEKPRESVYDEMQRIFRERAGVSPVTVKQDELFPAAESMSLFADPEMDGIL